MKLLLENWRRYVNEVQEQNQIDERGFGTLQRLGAIVGLTKDFNYDFPDMPYGGQTKEGKEFIVVQFPAPRDHRKGNYLVRFIDGTEETISGEEIKTAQEWGVRGSGPHTDRQIGSKIKDKMENSK